jgi:hypothetical protein
MKKILIIMILITAGAVFRAEAQYGFGTNSPNSQAIIDMNDPNKGLLIPRVELTATNDPSPFTPPVTASMLVYNIATDNSIPGFGVTPGFYYWNGTGWSRLAVTAQLPGTVTGDITVGSPLEISGGTDVLPSNVAINIKGAMRWFYMPGVPVSTLTIGNGYTLNLHDVYTSQFTNVVGSHNSTGATASIPTFAANELDYFVTGFDTNVFQVTQVDPDGTMHYNVISNATACSFINVVFVIK